MSAPPSSTASSWRQWILRSPRSAAAAALSILTIFYFYFWIPLYGPDLMKSIFGWMQDAWNSETNYEHGYLVPVIMAVMIAYSWKDIIAIPRNADWRGLFLLVLGALFYVVAFRTLQARIAVGSFPFVVLGCIWYAFGWPLARKLAYPIFFIYIALPLPSFQQSTVPLQVMATEGAQLFANLFGVETINRGTEISAADGSWEPLEVAGGCSGIRSLMALIMMSAAWAYLANGLSLWKRGILLVSAIPLAVIGNALRIGSICVLSDKYDRSFAAGTWHDWSGLLIFYPISLLLLFLLHSLLAGHLPWKRGYKKRIVIRRHNRTPHSHED